MGYEIFMSAGKRLEVRWDYEGSVQVIRFAVFSSEQGGAVS
jgi:hypothetical protein